MKLQFRSNLDFWRHTLSNLYTADYVSPPIFQKNLKLIFQQNYNYHSMKISAKDQGNELFKKGKYSDAIKHYNTYVQDSHQDNKNAYFNLSLCYSKLDKQRESIEAAEKALSLDPDYAKCYYRLALSYMDLGNRDYDTFINAANFVRLAPKQLPAQKDEMMKLAEHFKRFLHTKKEEKVNNLQEIIDETERLDTPRQLRMEVDKQISEWITEWNGDTQDQEAKLLEIRYIMEQIDYDYGLNLAYFYLNQVKDEEQRVKALNEINSIRLELNREQGLNVKQYQTQDLNVQIRNLEKKDSSDDENLFETDEKVQEKRTPRVFNTQVKSQKPVEQPKLPQTNIPIEQNIPKPVSEPKAQVPPATVTLAPVPPASLPQPPVSQTNPTPAEDSNTESKKTPKQMIEQLFKNKQKLQEYFGDSDIKMSLQSPGQPIQPVKPKPSEQRASKNAKQSSKPKGSCGCSHGHQQEQHHPKADSNVTRANIVEQLKNLNTKPDPPKVQPVKVQQKQAANSDIQQTYTQFCGWIATEKNKFAATFKCVLQILQSKKLTSFTKGQLLVLLKKRVKNFAVIMRSNSQNQQKILYNLLTKHGIEQYAIDLTPLFYKP